MAEPHTGAWSHPFLRTGVRLKHTNNGSRGECCIKHLSKIMHKTLGADCHLHCAAKCLNKKLNLSLTTGRNLRASTKAMAQAGHVTGIAVGALYHCVRVWKTPSPILAQFDRLICKLSLPTIALTRYTLQCFITLSSSSSASSSPTSSPTSSAPTSLCTLSNALAIHSNAEHLPANAIRPIGLTVLRNHRGPAQHDDMLKQHDNIPEDILSDILSIANMAFWTLSLAKLELPFDCPCNLFLKTVFHTFSTPLNRL